jgi:hypothetical protein
LVQIHEVQKEEDANEAIKNIIRPEVYPNIIKIWEESVNTGKPFEVEYEFSDPHNPKFTVGFWEELFPIWIRRNTAVDRNFYRYR